MKLLPLLLFAVPVVAPGCGPFFYPAPPALDHFPERLPVKTMRELLRETSPPAAAAATFHELSQETGLIAWRLGTTPRHDLESQIDKALERNRAGDYRKRFANCLYDFRDLLASEGAAASEISHYAAWRIGAMDWDDGFFNKKPTVETWEIPSKDFKDKRGEWQRAFAETADRLTAEAEKSSAVLKPHWLAQAGAWQFKHARFDEAARLFQRVIDEAPQHPRSEVARLMLARVRMEEWRAATNRSKTLIGPVEQDDSEKYRAADAALDEYLAAYPKGRFAKDIPGWRAGLAREAGEPSEAIRLFLQQIDFTDHPEIVRRAVRECEACLDDLDAFTLRDRGLSDGTGNSLPLDEIAVRPLAALAVVYHFLDSESRQDFDELLDRVETVGDRDVTDEYLPPVMRVRRAGREILPALARAVADRKENYGGKAWRAKYLAILAWAASESGDQTQALRVCDLAGPAIDRSDDLLFVRAVASQRAGNLDAAIAGFRRVQEKFPDSPLSGETRFRIATALRDKHEAGLAVAELMRIEMRQAARREQPPIDQGPGPNAAPDLHIDSEIGQWIDTLLQFAPLTELERGYTSQNIDPKNSARLRTILRLRYLARENFAGAARFAKPAPAEAADTEREVNYPAEITGDEWRAAVEKLISLKKAVEKSGARGERAEKLFALAEGWTSLRGRFTLPSIDDGGLFRNEFYSGWDLRYRNAQTAGISSASAAEELNGRDELSHAFPYYVQAADRAPGTPLAARALWCANDSLRRMAELSPWSSTQAFVTNVSAVSRKLHERLLRECPESVEAKRLSVWWSFQPGAELRWMPADSQDYNAEVAISDAFEAKTFPVRGSPQWEYNWDFKKRLDEVAAKAGEGDSARLLKELAAIRKDFLPAFASPRGAWVINHLDDLSLFLTEPGLTKSARFKYFAARLSDAPPALDDPEMKPWSDYLGFLAFVREKPLSQDANTGKSVFRPMSERMREFLDQYPKSRKREAALARLAIATVRETRAHTGVIGSDWPEAPKLGGYKKISVTRGVPFDAKQVFAALDAYDREFPNGRYAAEIRLWRGVAFIDAGNWKSAVQLLVATLDNTSKRDLHLDASLNLADIFMRLLDQPELRPEIIAALRGNPPAQARLRQFMHSDALGARLSCLEGYLDL